MKGELIIKGFFNTLLIVIIKFDRFFINIKEGGLITRSFQEKIEVNFIIQ